MGAPQQSHQQAPDARWRARGHVGQRHAPTSEHHKHQLGVAVLGGNGTPSANPPASTMSISWRARVMLDRDMHPPASISWRPRPVSSRGSQPYVATSRCGLTLGGLLMQEGSWSKRPEHRARIDTELNYHKVFVAVSRISAKGRGGLKKRKKFTWEICQGCRLELIYKCHQPH